MLLYCITRRTIQHLKCIGLLSELFSSIGAILCQLVSIEERHVRQCAVTVNWGQSHSDSQSHSVTLGGELGARVSPEWQELGQAGACGVEFRVASILRAYNVNQFLASTSLCQMDGTPPLKRKRTEESLPTPDPSPLRPSRTCTPPPPATRSTKFYFDDGDCVLRVDGVLFKVLVPVVSSFVYVLTSSGAGCGKVHRFLLTRDSVVFRDMFSGIRFQDKVPPNMNVNVCDEGIDDQRPIILPGDNSKAFEELLSVIYAL